MVKQKICSYCGKKYPWNKSCSCKERQNRNQYQREYYQKNKEILKPLSSKRWRKLRTLIIDRDHGHCQRCAVKFGLIETDNLQVHHIKPRIEYPELMFDENNLITLCKTCNLQIGTAEVLDFKPNKSPREKEFTFNL